MSKPGKIWTGAWMGIDAHVEAISGAPVAFLSGRRAQFEEDVLGILGAAVVGLSKEKETPDGENLYEGCLCGEIAPCDKPCLTCLARLEQWAAVVAERDALRGRIAKLEAALDSVLSGIDDPNVGPSKGCSDNSCAGRVCDPRRGFWAVVEQTCKLLEGVANGEASKI